MFKFSFTGAVLEENIDAVTAAIAVEMAKRAGMCVLTFVWECLTLQQRVSQG